MFPNLSLSRATVIDVGACFGLFTRHLMSRSSKLRVVAVEPAATSLNILRENLLFAGLKKLSTPSKMEDFQIEIEGDRMSLPIETYGHVKVSEAARATVSADQETTRVDVVPYALAKERGKHMLHTLASRPGENTIFETKHQQQSATLLKAAQLCASYLSQPEIDIKLWQESGFGDERMCYELWEDIEFLIRDCQSRGLSRDDALATLKEAFEEGTRSEVR